MKVEQKICELPTDVYLGIPMEAKSVLLNDDPATGPKKEVKSAT